MAHNRENPSGRPPRPYNGYKYGLLPYLSNEYTYNLIASAVSAAGYYKVE